MNTSFLTPPTRRRLSASAAFTLIELLVVISIIAVLAGLLLPVTNAVMKNARKTSCKTTEMQIVAAVNSYQTEYSQYPLPNDAKGDYTYGVVNNGNAETHNADLFNVLRALNKLDPALPTGTLNSRRIVYFEARNVKSATAPKDGFVLGADSKGNQKVAFNAGDLIDPFGNMYCVRVDGNYSNVLSNPYAEPGKDASDTPDATGTTSEALAKRLIRTGVISYSPGDDGKPGDNGTVGTEPYSPTPGDDVVSWQ